MGMAVAPAEAATGSWKPTNWYTNVGASGSYTRTSTKTTVKGKLADYRKDGYTACVRFLFTEPGTTGLYWTAKIMTTSGYHYDGKATVNISVVTSRTGHMYVQECGRNIKTGKYSYGKGKRIF
ncbi:hypothetical protein [Actinomadura sp. HBU206391]|uniref:hypothetical protein n=1 Tax=Actinomadura sp. HBU206391 TaxID=2731692 RepID=UPI0016509F20|nr:hypothetical protein [Actinomadura sp. HBU206391]MBC6458065.1 hypothetical protein [Actinomadura sp. HBU206391]